MGSSSNGASMLRCRVIRGLVLHWPLAEREMGSEIMLSNTPHNVSFRALRGFRWIWRGWLSKVCFPISNWYSVRVTRNFSLPAFITIIFSAIYRKQRPEMFWTQGCAKALQMKIIQNLHVIGIVAIVIAFFQVITFSFDVDCRDEKCFLSSSNYHRVNLILSLSHTHTSFSLQLFGLIISMLLFCTIKHKRKSDTYKSYSPTIDSSGHQRQSSYLDD